MRLYLITLVLLAACGGSESQDSVQPDKYPGNPKGPQTNRTIPDNKNHYPYRILIFGNSHTAGIAPLIQTLLNTGLPQHESEVVGAGGGFLSDNLYNQSAINKLKDERWTHVILQGQKYSQSGTRVYPTTAAQIWIARAKEQGATPVLFPEHPQIGNALEARQVHNLHKNIAEQQASCVAPVGLAWDLALEKEPGLRLHADDGNHAAIAGRLLTALVFYEVTSGQSADLLPYIPDVQVDEFTQSLLGQIASEAIQANPACE
ncbi:hypothetical protein L2725_18180 [Shewanella corallii]|uniref:SGNH/GDSL hydrolase family protein n=1 Tax=Shewanella corallii TaxID=560080 RepID=A0ABT0NC52_9GAMM|nr:hypothetical protein [Shewanella corallii]MCL2915685.1 hypothetical protein [Shewanella corallii]